MFYKSLTICFLIFISFTTLNAQDAKITRNNIGTGIGISKIFHEAGISPGIHLNYSRTLSADSPLSVCAGFEITLDKHHHKSMGIGMEYNFWKEFNICTSLGISFLPEGNHDLGIHFEISYSYEFGVFNLGPLIEYGIGPDDMHMMYGLQFGYGF